MTVRVQILSWVLSDGELHGGTVHIGHELTWNFARFICQTVNPPAITQQNDVCMGTHLPSFALRFCKT